MNAAVAAGHPATTDAGVEILETGGSAADAAVAASLASCVAETVMTGLLGGGHAIYFDAETGRAANLDSFVAVPGLGAEPRDTELIELAVPFGAELVHYAVGPASCGVPGVPAGLDALWRQHGRLPWARLFEPALRLAHDGVAMPAAHAACLAMLAPVMTMNDGARIYAPHGRLLAEGDILAQPGLVRALELLADEGARTVYTGTLASELCAFSDQHGGLVTAEDLSAYRPLWSQPAEIAYAGMRFLSRRGLSAVPDTLASLRPLAALSEPERALELVRALRAGGGGGDTTNISIVDRDGNACVLTTSLGLGSGDFLSGLDVQLNSMLGETDLVRGPLVPGERMGSMMAPSLALEGHGAALVAGAAGGTRLRSALVEVVAAILDEGLSPAEAVERPRVHPAPAEVHLEPGFSDATVGALEQAGHDVRVWPAPHHYFGGVSVITRNGAAGDPRRSGSATVLR